MAREDFALDATLLLKAGVGNYEDATRLLTEQVQADLPVRTRNLSWLVYAYCLAETAAILDRADAAAVLYELLIPYQGRTASAATVCNGYVDRPLGRLATTLGRFEDAHAHLNAAANVHERAGAPLFLARTLADHAALELASNGTAGRARELVDAALNIASEHRAPGVQEYVRRTKGLGLFDASQALGKSNGSTMIATRYVHLWGGLGALVWPGERAGGASASRAICAGARGESGPAR